MSAGTASVASAATIGTVGSLGFGLFGYNRENYMYDAGFRYERFTSGREYANQQADMFREDLRAMTTLVQKKTGMYSIFATLCLALCIALYCAGRLGLHGPSPPGWILGLWYTNNAAAFCFMVLVVWLSAHASSRAQACSTSLLLRKTRVPVPRLKDLDKARKFASEFEQQAWSDIFRVPFATNNGAPKTDRRSSSAPPTGRQRQRASSWIREEFDTDRAGTVTRGGAIMRDPDASPEHFHWYAKVQEAWYMYDTYARVALLYGYLHFIHGLGYYGLGHINVELRAFWVAYAVAFVLMVLHGLLLKFDIVERASGAPQAGKMGPAFKRKAMLPYCQWFGPLAMLPAAIGMSLDFRVQFSTAAIALCWFMIFVTHFMQLIYTLRLLECVIPDEMVAEAIDNQAGKPWAPRSWKVPSVFLHVIYLVAPPTKLRTGQFDVVREVKEGSAVPDENWESAPAARPAAAPAAPSPAAASGAPGTAPATPPAEESSKPVTFYASTAHIEPYKLVGALVGCLVISWCFLILGTIIDVAIGEQALITNPHWSRPPMTRMSKKPHDIGTPFGYPNKASGAPYLPEQMAWHEEKRHWEADTVFHAGGYDTAPGEVWTGNNGRRLDAHPLAAPAVGAGLAKALESLVEVLPRTDGSLPGLPTQDITWPGFFEPQLLACGPAEAGGSHVAAITPRGFGAAARVGGGAASSAEAFRLGGLMHLPPLLGASWGHAGPDAKEGLLVISRAGDLASCPGARPPTGGVWPCAAPVGAPRFLPVPEGARLAAATAAWLPGLAGAGGKHVLHAAVVHESAPEIVALFHHEGGDDSNAWLPLGEVPMPRGSGTAAHGGRISLAFAGDDSSDLLVSTGAGAVLRRRLRDGAVMATAHHAWGSEVGSAVADHFQESWQGACALKHNVPTVAHLHLRRGASAQARRPEIITIDLASNAAAGSGSAWSSTDPFYQ